MKKLGFGVCVGGFLLLLGGTGCATTEENEEFVRSINFSPLAAFSYENTETSGFDWRESQKELVRKNAGEAVIRQLEELGFEQDPESPDFYVVTQWDKGVSSSPGLFRDVDGPAEALSDNRRRPSHFAVRMDLTVEVYEAATDEVFWRSEQPDVFEAVALTGERVALAVERALEDFPERVDRDPDLPDIQ